MKSVLKKSERPRSDTSTRLERLQLRLRAMRQVHRLLLTETDPERLIERVCELLTKSTVYRDASIVLDGDQAARRLALLAELPLVASSSSDLTPKPGNADAAPARASAELTRLTHQLEQEGVSWGTIMASLPEAVADTGEEREQLRDLAQGLALALTQMAKHRSAPPTPPPPPAMPPAERVDGVHPHHLQSVFEELHGVPIQIYDEERRVVLWNPASERLYGYAREEALGKRLEELIIPPETREGVIDLVRNWYATGEAHAATEFELRNKKGERLRVYSNHVLIPNPRGRKELFSIDVDLTEMRRVEKHMAALSAVVENSDNIVVIKDLDLRVVATNRAFADVAGHETVESMIGKTDAEIFGVTPDTEPIRSYMADERFAQTLEPGHSILREEPVVTADGRRLTYLTRKYPIFSPSGTLIGTGNISTNITERNLSEKRLRETEQRFSTAFEHSPAPLVLSEIESGRLIDVNDRWVKMLGFTREEQIGRTSKAVGIWQDPEVRDRLVAVLRVEGRFQDEAIRFRRKSGETILCLWSAETVQLGGQQRMLSMITDVTKLRAAEHARERAQEELLEQTRSLELRNRIAQVFLTSPSEEIHSDVLQVLRDFFESRFGYFGYINDEGDLVCPTMTREIWEDCQIDDKSIVFPRKSWGGLWGRSLVEKRTLISNGSLRVPEGHLPLENAIATPILHRGECIGQFVLGNSERGFDERSIERLESAATMTAPILHSMLETARRKLHQRDLEGQLRQAQKMEAVGRLAGGVAHDFNNMLTVISMNAKLLLSDSPPDHSMREELEEIREAAQRSINLTRQLLAFAREQPVAPRVVELNDAVGNMLKMLQRLIGADVTVRWEPGEALWSLHLDPSQIDQILANLCVNARDAISDVGEIRISTQNVFVDAERSERQPGTRTGDYVMLSVRDDGCGIEESALALIFEPFFTTKEVGKGTGLGLATVYGAVYQNGGFLEVESEVGRGTTFHIYLPRHQPTTLKPPQDTTQGERARRKASILLVDDEAAILRLARRFLEAKGHELLTATTPTEALRIATEHAGKIHLLITDVVMPEMNGRSLAASIAALQPGMKCLFMSGYSGNVLSERGVADESANLLQKPFSDTELLTMVESLLQAE